MDFSPETPVIKPKALHMPGKCSKCYTKLHIQLKQTNKQPHLGFLEAGLKLVILLPQPPEKLGL